MDLNQKSSYLQFTNIWNRQKDHDAHTRRLEMIQSQRSTSYNYKRHKDFFDEKKNHFQQVTKQNDLFKKNVIIEDNNLLMKRLTMVTTKVESHHAIPSKRHQNHKKFLKQLYLIEENKRMKERIISAEAQLNFDLLREDFKKHQYYQKRMEKFYADDAQRVKLKAQENVDQQKQSSKIKKANRAHSFSTNEIVGQNDELTYLTSSPGNSDNYKNNNNFLQCFGPAFINHKLKTQTKQTVPKLVYDEQKELDKNLWKFRSFFRANDMIKFDQQLKLEGILNKEVDN